MGWFMLGLTVLAAWRMADYEERTPWPWGIGALLVAFWAPVVMGPLGMASPVVALALVFAGLWYLRRRDERNDRDCQGPRVVR